eukprot:11089450-Lingulodinium_polyedra.AAC.1
MGARVILVSNGHACQTEEHHAPDIFDARVVRSPSPQRRSCESLHDRLLALLGGTRPCLGPIGAPNSAKLRCLSWPDARERRPTVVAQAGGSPPDSSRREVEQECSSPQSQRLRPVPLRAPHQDLGNRLDGRE